MSHSHLRARAVSGSRNVLRRDGTEATALPGWKTADHLAARALLSTLHAYRAKRIKPTSDRNTPMITNHRSNDPPTSVRAGHDIESSGAARDQRTRCLKAVTECPGQTAREIEHCIGIKAHKRLPELREAGLVRNGPARICAISGRHALTWHLTGYRNTVLRPVLPVNDHAITTTGAFACH